MLTDVCDARLSNTRKIAEAPAESLRHYFREYPNVAEDCYAVARVEPDDRRTWALTTSGLGRGLVICARGTNARGETVLYLAHQTVTGSSGIDAALKVLSLDNGCDPRHAAVYILDGQAQQGTAVVLTQTEVLFCRSDDLPTGGREIFNGVSIEAVTDAESWSLGVLRQDDRVEAEVMHELPHNEQRRGEDRAGWHTS